MPDWSYQTLFRPLLFRLPSRFARAFTLGAMGAISRLPGGTFVIRTLGHMEPSPLLERRLGEVALPAPVGLSGGADPGGSARRALAQFGFGFMEIGPVTVRPIADGGPIENDRRRETILYPDYFENEGAAAVAVHIAQAGHRLPQFARIAPLPGSAPAEALTELGEMLRLLGEAGAAGFYIDPAAGDRPWTETLAICAGLPDLMAKHGQGDGAAWPLFLYVPPDLVGERLLELLRRPEAALWSGVVIGDAVAAEERRSVTAEAGMTDPHSGEGRSAFPVRAGRAGLEPSLRLAALVRKERGEGFAIKAGAGVHEPQDALDLLQAGADAVMLGSGLVYAGPGLPKRINEAVIHETVRGRPPSPAPSFRSNWGWMCLLGVSMIIGGLLAWWIGKTRVLLSYDLDFLGMTVDDIHGVSHHLLHFMSHDRVTLAGTMISIGILYYQLAGYGQRNGRHWARTALATSGIVGFSSFFLYLGYGYFDPLHAFAAAALLPMFILSLRGNEDRPSREPVNVRNDRIWRLAMWGQLCFVMLGFALAVGGLTIAYVGVTNVFVRTDLAFLGTTPEALAAANPKLISLIAHDRAGFGGALLCDALAILIIALWGIGQGRRWLWWTLLLGGAPGFYAGFSVHYSIGYTSFIHLLPAYFAALLYVAGLILLYPYMMRPVPTK